MNVFLGNVKSTSEKAKRTILGCQSCSNRALSETQRSSNIRADSATKVELPIRSRGMGWSCELSTDSWPLSSQSETSSGSFRGDGGGSWKTLSDSGLMCFTIGRLGALEICIIGPDIPCPLSLCASKADIVPLEAVGMPGDTSEYGVCSATKESGSRNLVASPSPGLPPRATGVRSSSVSHSNFGFRETSLLLGYHGSSLGNTYDFGVRHQSPTTHVVMANSLPYDRRMGPDIFTNTETQDRMPLPW
eukprot:g76845.t1